MVQVETPVPAEKPVIPAAAEVETAAAGRRIEERGRRRVGEEGKSKAVRVGEEVVALQAFQAAYSAGGVGSVESQG